MLPTPSSDGTPAPEYGTDVQDDMAMVDAEDPRDYVLIAVEGLGATAYTVGELELALKAGGNGATPEVAESHPARSGLFKRHEQDRNGKATKLTPEQKMLLEVAGLLVDACSNLIEARKAPEEGEIVDATSGVPESIRKALYTYRPSGPLEAIIYDDRKSKIEEAWDAMHTYAGALITWVQDARSTTLIPLERFRQLNPISKAAATPPRRFESDANAVIYVENRLEEIERKFNALQAQKQSIDNMWRNYQASREVECRAREITREAFNRAENFRETSLARLARLQVIHDRQTPQLDFIQRRIQAETPEIVKAAGPQDLSYYLRNASIAAAQRSQSMISELARNVGNQMAQVCADSVNIALDDVVNIMEEKLRPVIQALSELDRSSTNALDASPPKEGTLQFREIDGAQAP